MAPRNIERPAFDIFAGGRREGRREHRELSKLARFWAMLYAVWVWRDDGWDFGQYGEKKLHQLLAHSSVNVSMWVPNSWGRFG